MPDWQRLAYARLGRLGLAPEREADIAAEIAAHLEDAYDDARRTGAAEAAASAHALSLVPDWDQLAHELSMEADMNRRLKTLWAPGVTTGVLAMGVLFLLQRVYGLAPRLMWLDGTDSLPAFFLLPWLALLPLVGALGAFWSRRVGGSRAEALLAAIFASVALAAVFVGLFALSSIVDRHVPFTLRCEGFGALALSLVVVPGLALLLGALPFVGRSRGKAQPTPAA